MSATIPSADVAPAQPGEPPTKRCRSDGATHTLETPTATTCDSVSVPATPPHIGASGWREELGKLFEVAELDRIAGSPGVGTLVLADPAGVASRVGQARFVLAGITDTCSAAETEVVRESFVLQPRYFEQAFTTAFVSESMVVVDKPFDTQISHGKNQTPRFPEERSVAEGLAAQLGGPADGYKRCHNLDFATSGALVMARTPAALKAGMQAFDHSAGAPGHVQKEYAAVLLGWPDWDSTTIDATIETDPTSAFKMRVSPAAAGTDPTTAGVATVAVPGSDGGAAGTGTGPRAAAVAGTGVIDVDVASRWGPSRMPPAPRWSRDARAAKAREAITVAHVVRRGTVTLQGPLFGAKATLVRLLPRTGRRHQLRVHMAHLGHPLLGDVSYAGDISTHRLCLHAVSVTFEHSEHDVSEGQGTPAETSQHLPPSGLCITTASPFESFVT